MGNRHSRIPDHLKVHDSSTLRNMKASHESKKEYKDLEEYSLMEEGLSSKERHKLRGYKKETRHFNRAIKGAERRERKGQ